MIFEKKTPKNTKKTPRKKKTPIPENDEKTTKIKHPNLNLKSILGKKTQKKNSKKTTRKKHQFCKLSKKTPTDKTPISEKGKKNTFLTTSVRKFQLTFLMKFQLKF